MNATVTNAGDTSAAIRALTDLVCGFARPLSNGDPRGAMEHIQRAAVGYSGVAGGFLIKPELAASVLDRTRLRDGPFKRCNWLPCKYRTFWLPVVNETNRATARWGGVNANVGQSEDFSMTSSQSSIGRINFNMNRLDVYTGSISRNLMEDSRLIGPWLDYAARSAIRFALDAAMIGGGSASSNTGGIPSTMPLGILNSPASVAVSRNTSNEIKAADIDALWSAVYGPCKSTAVFHASDEVIQYIDQTAQTGGWAESLYFPQGVGGNEYALIKGRPLIPCESCSALGTSGDIVVSDWNSYFLVYHSVDENDSGLAFSIAPPSAAGQSGWGAWGMPSDSVEARVSDQYQFLTDALSFAWKLRVDGSFTWDAPTTNINGASVGPCAYLA